MQITTNSSSNAAGDNSEEFDLVVLGCGEAGKYIAWTTARQGKRVVVVERKYIGGSCPNIACLPSKNIIHSAQVAHYFSRAKEFGMRVDGFQVDMTGVRDRKRAMVQGLVDTHLANFKSSGAELLIGSGQFTGPRTLQVTTPDGARRTISGKNVVISTGSRATIDDIPGLRQANPLTHVEALDIDHVPEHLLIIGGGYIGLEMAQAFRRLRSRVTVLDRNSRLLHLEDSDITDALHELCRDEGVDIVTQARVTRVEGQSGRKVSLSVDRNRSLSRLEGSHLLVAAGRTPNTGGIGLDAAGVAVDDRGNVKVNERLETTAPGVWAVGDCAGSPHFTHVAFDDFRILRENFAGGNRTTTGRQVPFCLYTDPEFARVGMSESEAKKRGVAYRLAKIPMMAVLRTRTLSETRGFMKALIDPNTERILGFATFGAHAGETVAAVQLTMQANLPFTVLRDTILVHPTISEGLGVLLMNVPNHSTV
jgi:pyruvate/2-oxoglutarate dehydrogenase complex dihydrolipoamide dehydrogenase (E3) component